MQFKEGDEVLVKATFVRHDPGYGDCVRFSNRNNIHVASPDVLPASTLDVNKELLEEAERACFIMPINGIDTDSHAYKQLRKVCDAARDAIAAAEQAKESE